MFNVEEGRFYAVMGSSGSGKTTLLNVISGIDKFDSGEIIIDNVRLSALTRTEMADFRLNNVGIVYQNYNLIDCLTLRENILRQLFQFPREVLSLPRHQQAQGN
ncbi:MAG: ATP-binding cassette domain-containing protein [Parasporobacterium sp.]|nr:ATP-binding cassette domain-containing protein [Parasporobacterium sp.]